MFGGVILFTQRNIHNLRMIMFKFKILTGSADSDLVIKFEAIQSNMARDARDGVRVSASTFKLPLLPVGGCIFWFVLPR